MGVEETNAGINIPASFISVRLRTIKTPDCVSLVRYQTGSGIISFFAFWYRIDRMPYSSAFKLFPYKEKIFSDMLKN